MCTSVGGTAVSHRSAALGGSSIRLALPLLETIASYGTRFVVCDLRACHVSIVYAVRVGLREMLIFV